MFRTLINYSHEHCWGIFLEKTLNRSQITWDMYWRDQENRMLNQGNC